MLSQYLKGLFQSCRFLCTPYVFLTLISVFYGYLSKLFIPGIYTDDGFCQYHSYGTYVLIIVVTTKISVQQEYCKHVCIL